ncbi:ABC transporter ATP-binding protein [Halalkalicoccus subterraneus]|uniref:ABC transporter ATP-binding protein n=1 Tax=Halalkalicoccus subterraneus TaxID=2675002 RepID=UPI000EFBFADF|nr:ABC transporter ATP-binding protein [Halalkalicoccus subterraneus]
MSTSDSPPASRREKIDAMTSVLRYNPRLTGGIIALGVLAATLEGVGLSFILPIIELVQSEGGTATDGIAGVFVAVYRTVGVPLTLGTAVAGVVLVMSVRFTASFFVAWFREALRTYYIRDLQTEAFSNAFDAKISYFDEEGSDDVLNAIITQTFYAGRVIESLVLFFEQSLLAVAYGAIALVISPVLTVVTAVALGGATYLSRSMVESGYDVGESVADANERRQEAAQAGTQGMRDIRIFGIGDELYADFRRAVEQYTDARITLRRNEALISNFYQFVVAVSVFGLIYLSLTLVELSLSYLGLFLFAMFRLGPKASRANELVYQIENDLPHLVRTQAFTAELARHTEPSISTHPVPKTVDSLTADGVEFSYDGETPVLRGIDFEARKGESIAFIGQSGAGKSTIVSLLSRMYEPTGGEIRANGTSIHGMDIDEWREHIAVVRQDPYVFNDTLRYNLTIGNRNVSRKELDRICAVARVDEFLDDLPNGYETYVGDEGVRLSGGQKQRVALARALLDDADVLILDEATSDLDSNLEREVQRAIETMDHDYIVVTIAHRLSTVKNADRIYTLEEGRIAEAGDHSELVENDGTYADLYAIQTEG